MAGSRRLAAVGLAAAAALALGCGPESSVRYQDFIVSGQLASALSAVHARRGVGEAFCADETRYGVIVAPGATIELRTRLGEAPRLVFDGCAGRAEAGDLTVTVEGTGHRSTESRMHVTPDAWSVRSLDLSRFAGEPVTLRLHAGVPAGGRLLISRFYVRDRLPPAPDPGSPPRLQVLLISLDTLRADAVGAAGAAGGSGSATPALDAFAERSETWSPHYSAATWTKPSHASLLTGLPVEVHGAELAPQAISPSVETLAERFQAAGFTTSGLVRNCLWLDRKWGFDRGFGSYRVVLWRAGQAARATADWIADHRGEPFFYFLHLYTAHSDTRRLPYESEGMHPATVEELFGVPGYGCRRGACASKLLTQIDAGEIAPIPREPEILRYLYEAGISTADAALGRLFRDLREDGLFDRLLIVVTADHGEAFEEHGKLLHPPEAPYRELLEVPLLIKWPGGRHAGERRTTPSSSLDIAPTLLAAAGLSADGLPGSILGERKPNAPVFSGTTYKSVIAGGLQAIFPPGDTAPELYDLERDPREGRDLAASRPGQVVRMRELLRRRLEADARLRAALQSRGEAPSPDLTPEERQRLEALGYLQ